MHTTSGSIVSHLFILLLAISVLLTTTTTPTLVLAAPNPQPQPHPQRIESTPPIYNPINTTDTDTTTEKPPIKISEQCTGGPWTCLAPNIHCCYSEDGGEKPIGCCPAWASYCSEDGRWCV
ncbi:hypothetical protein DFH27DRAFT_536536, partial [Peziza echinospora]